MDDIKAWATPVRPKRQEVRKTYAAAFIRDQINPLGVLV